MRLRIDRLGHLGDAVADGPDGPVYVPRALPGELVEGEVVAGRMEAPKILVPSPYRVLPPCPHYRSCGGCALQHASDAFVAGWKADVLRTALAGQGLGAPIRAVHTSPAATRRRATLAGRRTKSGAIVGFHARASGTLAEVPGCAVLRPELLAALPALREATVLGASRKGEIAFALSQSDAGLDVAALGGKQADAALLEALARLAERHDLARLSWNGAPVASRRLAQQSFGAARVTPPPGAFLQATREGEAALLAGVREAVGGAARLADLFAGCGTFALPLASAAEVHAVEGDGAMVASLLAGARSAAGLKRVTAEARDLFRRPLLPEELARYAAVVLDPPRAGAEAQVAMLAASVVPVIAYVSCNPVTFARDARQLAAAGYVIDWLDVVDQFRWSPHVELVARLVRPAPRR
ncbi:class I SAM-dependent RNA methyltransferase [Phaeovulum sp.]|uniref:class I SAM-dependent RNA methyltransferase n=1 Tax=Phaeovulum sp. TaxID=2934796 RepID=UPI00272FAC88|nr:class I SAM-dependent RNA methyltransferase [Phaeovulum sp.]MDP1669255.1 class I SAM-dependent RNA methyltransferase [Phaeovulum sp.]MDZ4119280.1 class I SAM-dependent RNA methyltransferase [Phaeovulum sp.]